MHDVQPLQLSHQREENSLEIATQRGSEYHQPMGPIKNHSRLDHVLGKTRGAHPFGRESASTKEYQYTRHSQKREKSPSQLYRAGGAPSK